MFVYFRLLLDLEPLVTQIEGEFTSGITVKGKIVEEKS
jgi:hypothetical protein